MVSELVASRDVAEARSFIEGHGLAFDGTFDNLLGCHQAGRLVATGARQGNILKMLAVATDFQGGGLLEELVTELIKRGFAAGIDSFFLFTAPEHATTFEALNFSLLVSHGRVALLEYGHGLERYLARHRRLLRGGRSGAAVVNCNPFTLGHRFLIETAARKVEHLYLFVVREERSHFPFADRFRMVEEGVADLANVSVLDTGPYAVSSITFPTYFLKDHEPADQYQLELDLLLFARRLAPAFGIDRRFVGSEPLCAVTAAYNEAMRAILPGFGIEVTEVPRKCAAGGAISASRVRRALEEGDEELLAQLVPAATLARLREGMTCGKRVTKPRREP